VAAGTGDDLSDASPARIAVSVESDPSLVVMVVAVEDESDVILRENLPDTCSILGGALRSHVECRLVEVDDGARRVAGGEILS
jgi:flavin reductase (DIM6/NTAB) family NADH-FMN oxidoreductase RutF